MAQLTRHRLIEAPADVVWAVVTDPDVYADVAPNLSSVEILEGDGEGMVRQCVDIDGNAWTETCTAWEAGRGFAVAVDVETSEFHRRLFTRFDGEWRLTDRVDGVLVTMRFDFETKYGPLGWLFERYMGFKAGPLIEAIFDGWEAEIERRSGRVDPAAGEGDGTGRALPPNRGPR